MVSTINIQRTDKGFTLIELLVVIAIIGVLAAVVLLAINPAELLKRSRDSTRLSDLSTLRKAIDASITESTNTQVPTCTGANGCSSATGSRAVIGTANGMWLNGGTGVAGDPDLSKYIGTLPVDPSQAGGAATITTAMGGYTPAPVYRYKSTTTGTYKLGAYMESAQNAAKANQDGGNIACAASGDHCVYETGTDLAGITLTGM